MKILFCSSKIFSLEDIRRQQNDLVQHEARRAVRRSPRSSADDVMTDQGGKARSEESACPTGNFNSHGSLRPSRPPLRRFIHRHGLIKCVSICILCVRRFETMSSPTARPYRSKRQRPCDQCRARKLGCQTTGGAPCQRCRSAKLECTFDNPPPKRARVSDSLPFAQPVAESLITQPCESTITRESSVAGSGTQSAVPRFPSLGLEPSSHGLSPASGILGPGRPPTQFVQSIDQLEHGHAQLFGASAESDPWLLRHCCFDDQGMKYFYKVHFRNAGGVPTAQRIPIHFMISSEELTNSIKHETRAGVGEATRERLNLLVPLEYGRRLVAL